MRYDFEFKKHCVEMLKQGKYPKTPEGVSTASFKSTVRQWRRIVDYMGKQHYDILKPIKN